MINDPGKHSVKAADRAVSLRAGEEAPMGVNVPTVIPGCAEGADPESRGGFLGARLWIPGSLAMLAPRNDED